MPDRELTNKETKGFIRHTFLAIPVILDNNKKPTLHDLAIIELAARLDTLKEHIIDIEVVLKDAIKKGKI